MGDNSGLDTETGYIDFELIQLPENHSEDDFISLFCRNHSEFSENYLKQYFPKIFSYLYHFTKYKDDTGHRIRTVVIEHPYFSESYISDYSRFYSKIFKSYERNTSRIHFFTELFDESAFQEMMADPNHPDYTTNWDSYIGYIVEKPLPNSIIGATVIRPYEDNRYSELPYDELKRNKLSKRYYNSVRDYDVRIGAKKITLKTLIFQQQDRAVSACATISLWVAINMLHHIFRCPLIKPSQITEYAGEKINAGRMFPNEGLDANQVIRVINKIGLVAEIFSNNTNMNFGQPFYRQDENEEIPIETENIINNKVLRELTYAYNSIGIPLLLGYKINSNQNGNHLTTIVGYKIDSKLQKNDLQIIDQNEELLLTKSQLINRLYVHDDQLGPFTRLEFYGNNQIQTKFVNEDYSNSSTKLLIIPVIDEIRLKYDDVAKIAKLLDEFIKTIIEKLDFDNVQFLWDIRLEESNNFKDSALVIDEMGALKEEILYTSFPKYIWVARIQLLENYEIDSASTAIDFIFDSSEIGVGVNFSNMFVYDIELLEIFIQSFRDEKVAEDYSTRFSRNPNIISKFISIIRNMDDLQFT